MELAGGGDKENAGGGTAADAARQQLLARLLGSGVLNSVKAHLRAKLFAELKGQELSSVLAPAPSPTLQQHVLNCLTAEYLLAQQYKYTLSVFLSESGTHKLPALGAADLLRLAGVAPGSRLYALALAKAPGAGCLAAGLLEALAALEACGPPPAITTACQTEEAPAGGAALAARLGAIEAEFARRSAALESAAARSAEERVAEAQRAAEARFEARLAEEVARVRGAELGAAREAEAARAATALAAEREALQRACQERLERLRQQEAELVKEAREAQQRLEQEREELAQRQRAEEERLRAWREQEEALLAIKAAEARRQERQAVEQQRAAEERMQALQQELQRREEDLRRQQAALDHEREQLSRSRAELAGQAAETESLRRQLASLADSHAVEKAGLQREHAALQEQLQRLQGEAAELQCTAAGTASAEGQQAQRLAHEVAVGRARERLWRECASANERLLDKAGKWQEQCLQQCEELRLALAAAAREVADLQQRAQLAAAEASGPLGLALASAASDAQQWREAARARLDAAGEEEGRLRQELARLNQRAMANRLHTAQSLQGLLAKYVQGRRQPEAEPAAAAFGKQPEAAAALTEGEDEECCSEQAAGQPACQAAPRQHQRDERPEDESNSSDEASPSPAPASRTSHILAAYRARQAAAAAAGRVASQAAAAAAPEPAPTGAFHPASAEASPMLPAPLAERQGPAAPKAEASAGGEGEETGEEECGAGEQAGAEQGGAEAAAAEQQVAGGGAAEEEEYYISDISDLSSDESSKF